MIENRHSWNKCCMTDEGKAARNHVAFCSIPQVVRLKMNSLYRNDSNEHPGRFINFSIFTGALIQDGHLKEAPAYSFPIKVGEDRKDN